ncbi:hypothetical protein Y1Q_0019442 [Alligator mississippiensis]|uniref:GB1/RHD3-type G domain-containing protein n=1 Tax=Alligator mississippiensis TaxID=8496 RepID=A0A151M1G7_ALLMI|nr:hypothetical protein Y1Q_0019442 [Alligator mississippiensis]
MGHAVQAVSVLQKFLQSQDAVANTILQADHSLSEPDKELSSETAPGTPAPPAPHPSLALTQHPVPPRAAGMGGGSGVQGGSVAGSTGGGQAERQEAEHSHEEHMRQLKAQLEAEHQQLLDEHWQVLDHKLRLESCLLEAATLSAVLQHRLRTPGNTKNDCWIFALAVLLSSLLVYNSKGTVDQYAMEQLHFVSELMDHIKVKAQEGDGEGDDTEFIRFFPGFIWAVQEFTLQLISNGQPVTEDQYLENALALKPGNSKRVMEYNLPHQCLCSFFPTCKCFIFVQTVPAKDISQLELLPESTLDPQFLVQTCHFCNYVFQEAKAKTVKGRHCVNGRMFSSLVQNYVKTIRSGKVPCIDNTVIALAATENEAAITAALAHYEAEMRKLQLPVELDKLLEAHGKCEEGALKLFMEHSFRDSEQQYQKQLVVGIAEQRGNILAQNEDVSKEICLALLEELPAPMKKNLSDGVYSRPGGYGVYKADLSQVVEGYWGKPNKGVKAEEVLDQFLAKMQPEAAAVLKVDTKLTEAEKHIVDEKQKAEVWSSRRRQRRRRGCRWMTKRMLMKDQERSYEENLKQLKAKMKDEAERVRKEAAQVLEYRLKEQEAILSIFTTIGEGLRAINGIASLTKFRQTAQPKHK